MSNTVQAAGEAMPIIDADVNRAKAIVLTVWLALQSPDLGGGCEGDIPAIGDTFYEAIQRLTRAEKNLGAYK